MAVGNANTIAIKKEINFPHSLGLIYSAFTGYLGFEINEGEYKMMGLAPYGRPRYAELIKDKLIDIKEDGSFRLNMDFFDFVSGLKMTNKNFHQLFGQEPRVSEEQLTPFHTDLAASIQSVTEEILLKMVAALSKEYGIPNLCLSGGVALNCVANGKILDSGYFKNIWIQPASGDAGGALGCALAVWHKELNKPRAVNPKDSMKGSYLGPMYEQGSIEKELLACGAKFDSVTEDEMIEQTSQALADGKAVGWFQGRMEFGPRSLGSRSILGDPRSEKMQKTLNLKVKYRESFRPFAPSILREDITDWFELDYDSPYMLLVDDVRKDKRIKMTSDEESLFGIDKLNIKRSSIPAVTHVDYSARIQTVHKETNPTYHALITKFKEKTGCSVVVNTSFNVRGEPIVCSPEDAFRCFMGTDLDILVIENCFLVKDQQDKTLFHEYKDNFELD